MKTIIILLSVIVLRVYGMDSIEIDKQWNYKNSSETREKFLQIQKSMKIDEPVYAELMTQIARTYSLAGQFDEAHNILDKTLSLIRSKDSLANVRYLLEKGRTYNSSKNTKKALSFFIDSYEVAVKLKEDFYAIDAAHMVSIAENDIEQKRLWTKRGIELAEKSPNDRAKKWLGSLTNNLGWDYHEARNFDQAMIYFNKALEFNLKYGNAETIFIAKWAVARCLRSLGENLRAIDILKEVEEEMLRNKKIDGYVYEELAENYLVKNNPESKKYFKLALSELSKDEWFVQNEQSRLKRLEIFSEK